MRGSVYGADNGRIWNKYCIRFGGGSCANGIERVICIFVGGKMKRVVIEYAGSVIAVMGTLGFFSVVSRMFASEGMLAEFISAVLGGL